MGGKKDKNGVSISPGNLRSDQKFQRKIQSGEISETARSSHKTNQTTKLPSVGYHSETKFKNEKEKREIEAARRDAKSFHDTSKAQGLSNNQIMNQILRGKTGHEFHAAKMVIVFENNQERARELRQTFPEVKDVPDSLSRSDVNKLLLAAGYRDKREIKAALKQRRNAYKEQSGSTLPAESDQDESNEESNEPRPASAKKRKLVEISKSSTSDQGRKRLKSATDFADAFTGQTNNLSSRGPKKIAPPVTASPTLGLRGGGADAKRKAARKRKFAHLQHDSNPQLDSEHPDILEDDSKSPSKKAKGDLEPPPASPPAPQSEKATESSATEQKILEESPNDDQPSPRQRFICFVGNLPYNTTAASLTTHFSSLHPTSIRHRTDPKTNKSKGFAFIEFDNYDRLKTCLKLFHHSMFDPNAGAEGKDSEKRRINVELTAGGGGSKSQSRRAKLATKNARLNEERKRRGEKERMTKGKEKIVGKSGGVADEKRDVEREDGDGDGDVHPSRRGRVGGGGQEWRRGWGHLS